MTKFEKWIKENIIDKPLITQRYIVCGMYPSCQGCPLHDLDDCTLDSSEVVKWFDEEKPESQPIHTTKEIKQKLERAYNILKNVDDLSYNIEFSEGELYYILISLKYFEKGVELANNYNMKVRATNENICS